MNSSARSNLILAAVALLLIGGNVSAFTYSWWEPKLSLLLTKPVRDPTNGEHPVSECLKVSDFYSVQLTTYFLADSYESAGGPTDDTTRYDEYCDQVPGTGRVIFSVVLMEKDARDESVVLSFSRYEPKGELTLLNALPPNPHPRGILALDATVAHPGKYLLRLAFGAAKNKEDIIEMPISVGR